MVDLFNENSLRADISKTWGEHGAHIDVFDMMLKKMKEVPALIEIDVQPMTTEEPARWSVKINSKERSGFPDEEFPDLPTWADALEAVADWMRKEVKF